MVFEMLRSFNKIQFKLAEHIDRLFQSAKYLRIDIPYTRKDVIQSCLDTIEANEPLFNDDDEHRLMINVTRGLLGLYQGIDTDNKGPNVIIADFPLRWTVQGMGKLFDSGVNAVIPSQRTIPANLLEPKVKNRSRIHYLMANIEVSQYKGNNNWALLLDPDGYVAEGTGSNFFIVKDGYLMTPEPRNILRGISRQYVMSLKPSCEKNIEIYDVINADEAFYTGTPFCVLPVTSINGIPIGKGKIGNITQEILKVWSQNVGVDIVKQIKKWDKNTKETGVTPYAFTNK
jgi:branched-chain amino acid aminotransferase